MSRTGGGGSDVDYTWRDSELRSPPLRALNRVGARLDRWGVGVPSLSPSSVVRAATKLAGSDDLGTDTYREPLEVYLDSCRNEAELTTFGRLLIAKMLAGALANRIELHRWSLDHPEVREERIRSPWVIVGLPRTGTSVLSMLLGLDPVARPLLQWEAAHPIPPPTLEGEEDPRIARTAKDLDGLMKLNPPLKAMHPFGATLAEECVSLFMYDVRTLALETQAHVPSYGRWLEEADMAPAYAQHRLALQTLQSHQPTERWILKTPNHLWHLEALGAAYPDARIIWTHRDPGPVVTSLASLANAAQRPLTSRSDPRPTAEEWKRKCSFALGSAMAFDDHAADGWCRHLHYHALMADPLATVRDLYRSFGDEVGELHARRMEVFLEDRPKDAFGRHRYDPADFAWSYAGLGRGVQPVHAALPRAHGDALGGGVAARFRAGPHLGPAPDQPYDRGMSERSRYLPRRSCMSSPGSNERFLAKAPTVPADMSFLDLEDSVAPLEKEAARAKVADAIKNLPWDDRVLCVRINAWDTEWTYGDVIDVVSGAGERLDELMLPKVQSAAEVVALDLLLTQVEKKCGLPVGHVGIEAQIETTRGLINVEEICAASPRLETIIFGPADFAASMEMPVLTGGVAIPEYPGDHFNYVFSKILMAGRANGLQVIDGPFLKVRELDSLREFSQRTRVLGYDGKWALTPDQVGVLNEVYSPTQEQFDRAWDILDAYRKATEDDRSGAVMFGDEMIDEASRKMATKFVTRGERAGLHRSSH